MEDALIRGRARHPAHLGPGTVYGATRDTPMRTIMARQAEFYGAHTDDRPIDV